MFLRGFNKIIDKLDIFLLKKYFIGLLFGYLKITPLCPYILEIIIKIL